MIEFDEAFNLDQGVSVVLSQPQGLSLESSITVLNEEDIL